MQAKFLNIFQYKKRGYLFFVFILLFILLAILTFFAVHILFKSIFNPTFILIISAIVIIILYHLLKYKLSNLRFKEIGKFYFNSDGIIHIINDIEKDIKWKNIAEVDINIADEKYWRSEIDFIQKYKIFLRYHNLNSYIDADKFYDYIKIDNEKYYVKINNHSDMHFLAELAELTEDLGKRNIH